MVGPLVARVENGEKRKLQLIPVKSVLLQFQRNVLLLLLLLLHSSSVEHFPNLNPMITELVNNIVVQRKHDTMVEVGGGTECYAIARFAKSLDNCSLSSHLVRQK